MDIQAKYKHSKLGQLFFNISSIGTKFLVKHKFLYFFLNIVWGLLLTIFGFMVALVLLIIGCNFSRFYWMLCANIGPSYWGGLSLGLIILRDQKSGVSYINNHELGHSFQNAIFGPLTPFIVTIPSACRYWYQILRERRGKENIPYDSAWFEDAATQCGNYAALILYEKKNK